MLDRKTKDSEASVEILEDRGKLAKMIFALFFIIGWSIVAISALLIPYKYSISGIGIGIAFLFFATWFYIELNYYATLIMIKKMNKKE